MKEEPDDMLNWCFAHFCPAHKPDVCLRFLFADKPCDIGLAALFRMDNE